MFPIADNFRAIACRNENATVCIYRGSCRCPYSAFALRWHLIREQRSRSIRERGDNPAMIISAIAEQSAVRDIHDPLRQRKRGALLLCAGLHSVWVCRATHFYFSRPRVNADQDVRRASHLGNG